MLPEDDTSWDQSWAAIKAVWASKWNARAVSSFRKARLDHSKLQMAVLCQPVVPAKYAFVAHTKHPTSGAYQPPNALSLIFLATGWWQSGWSILAVMSISSFDICKPVKSASEPLATLLSPGRFQ